MVGSAAVDGPPMAIDSIFRLASITKPITAAAVMMLIEDGRIALQDSVNQWLPELSKPTVVRTPSSPIDDVVPAIRPITVSDLLSCAGYGFPSDFHTACGSAVVSSAKGWPGAAALPAARRMDG